MARPRCPRCQFSPCNPRIFREFPHREFFSCPKCRRVFTAKAASPYKGSRWPWATIRKLEKYLKDNPGVGSAVTARAMGLSQTGVYQFMRKHGYPVPKPGAPLGNKNGQRDHPLTPHPPCPKCNSTEAWSQSRKTGHNRAYWKCKSCHFQFSEISGTNFRNSKLPPEKLAEMIQLMKDHPGLPAWQLMKKTGVAYKTAYVFQKKYFEGDKPVFEGETQHSGYWQGRH